MHYDIATCQICGDYYPVQGLVYNSLCAFCDALPEPDRTRGILKTIAYITAHPPFDPPAAKPPPEPDPKPEPNMYEGFFN